MAKPINRLKVVLAEKMVSNKWIAEQLGCRQAAVSKWCTNTSQPDLETLMKLANLRLRCVSCIRLPVLM